VSAENQLNYTREKIFMYDNEIAEIWNAINCIVLELQQLQQAIKELEEKITRK
jgi:hypothetical protein